MLISRQNEIFQDENVQNLKFFKFVFDMVLKVSQTILYRNTVEKKRQKNLVPKKKFQLIKIFILSEKCLSVPKSHFYMLKMLKIWNF